MATALTLTATNPLSNPLKASNYGIRRKASVRRDGASVYARNSFCPSPLPQYTYSVPSPVLVVKPAIPSSPLHNKPVLSSTTSTATAETTATTATAATAATATTATTVTTTTATATTTPSPTLTTQPLKLSYADVLKSPKSSSTLLKSSSYPPLKSSATLPTPSPRSSPLLNGTTHRTRMDKKLAFETERTKLKARRLAKKGFERQTGKPWSGEISQHEWEIYQTELKKHEEALIQQKRDDEAAAVLAANIKHKESVLTQLQRDLSAKVKLIETGKEELERFRFDFEESLKQQIPSSSVVQKSAAMRMREEQEKKKLRVAWRNNCQEDNHAQQTRRNILIAQEDVAALNLVIINLKKELSRMKQVASKERSSKQIMRSEKLKREDRKRLGIEKPKAEPKPKPPPAAPVKRSHEARMAEQQALKVKARATRHASSSSSSSTTLQCP